MLDDQQKAALEHDGGDTQPNKAIAESSPWDSNLRAIVSRENMIPLSHGRPKRDQPARDISESRTEQVLAMAAEEPVLRSHALPKLRKDLDWGLVRDLNQSQASAVSAALGRCLTLIQGPPGTGKTTVSVKLLELWTKKLWIKPVLATSDSNIAVDNIAEGCQKLGIKVVRLGRTEKITYHLEDVTLESMLKRMRNDQEA